MHKLCKCCLHTLETTSTSNDFSQGKDMNKVSSFESTKKRRGKYAPYAPKLRAEIAMYSASHTNLVGFYICNN